MRGASLCSLCKSYQRRWKNHLQYFAGMAALLVIVISAGGWIYYNIWKPLWYYDDVQVLSANSLQSAVVVNRGDGEVFVSHMALFMAGRSHDWKAPRLDFEQILSPGHFLKKDFPPSKISDEGEFIRGLKPAEFEKLLVRAANNDPCFELVF